MGWVTAKRRGRLGAGDGRGQQALCRGQVTPDTHQVVTYEVTIREIGYRPEPYAVVRRPDVRRRQADRRLQGLSLQLSGVTHPETGGPAGRRRSGRPSRPRASRCSTPAIRSWPTATATRRRPSANPTGCSTASARSPACRARPSASWTASRPPKRTHGSWRRAVWIEAAVRCPARGMVLRRRAPAAGCPFASCWKSALQPCGWLAAYVGSALKSPQDLLPQPGRQRPAAARGLPAERHPDHAHHG